MFGDLLQAFFRESPESSERSDSGNNASSKSQSTTEQETSQENQQSLTKDDVNLVIRKSKQIKLNPIVKKAIDYVSINSSLDWFDMLRFNVLSSTNETVESLSHISMEDLFKLNEFIGMKQFIESVQYAVEQDEINKANKPKR